eukprot:TRINITY_DN28218_c0_g3_i4.p1 TRINITY_DN28218_c0_g3~~TRINITY_DN28218_c0_g3_i4.p1  ORF type:complete len:653 (-),score=79.30 TRINITY_DN28218_c0_g3_i4:18-1976(-)
MALSGKPACASVKTAAVSAYRSGSPQHRAGSTVPQAVLNGLDRQELTARLQASAEGRIDSLTATRWLRSLAKSSQTEAAVSLLVALQDLQVQADLFHCNAALGACIDKEAAVNITLSEGADNLVLSSWMRACDVVQWCARSGLAPDVYTYCGAIRSCRTTSGWQTATAHMAAAASRSTLVDLAGFSAAIAVCERSQEWSRAAKMLTTGMARASLEIDNGAVFSTIVACSQARQWRATYALMRDGSMRNLEPDTKMKQTATNSLQGSVPWKRVLSSIYGILTQTQFQENPTNLAIVVKACASALAWRKVIRLLEEAVVAGLETSHLLRSSTMKVINDGHMGTWQEILEEASRVSDDGGFLGSADYGVLMAWPRRQGLWQQALQIVSTAHRAGNRRGEYIITDALATCGTRWALALTLYDSVALSGLRADAACASAAITPFERAQHWPAALFFCTAVKEARRDACSAAISACGKSKCWLVAEALLEKASTHGGEADVVTVSATLSSLEKAEKWDKALQSLRRARALSFQLDILGYNAVTSAGEACGQWALGFQLCSASLCDRLDSNAASLGALISCCEKGAQWRAATWWLYHSEVSPGRIAHSAAIQACLTCKHWIGSLYLLQRMEELTFQDPSMCALVLAEVEQRGQTTKCLP